MEPRFESLLRRLEQLSADVQELREGVRQSVLIASQDPEMSLTRARKVLEYIVRDVYQNAYAEPPGTRPLENLLQRLIKDEHFPKRLAAYANAIRELGNVGTHGFGEGVTTQDVFQSLTQLTPIVEWYFLQRRPSPAASQTPRPAPDVAPSQGEVPAPARGPLSAPRSRRRLMIAGVGAAVLVMLGVVTLLLCGAGWLFPGKAGASPDRADANPTAAPQPPAPAPRDNPAPLAEPARAVAPFAAAKAKQLQQAWADYLGTPVTREVDLGGGATMKLNLIPPGAFRMGSPDSDPEASDEEKPQHPVEITQAFYMAVGPVTKGQFAAFVQAEQYKTEAEKGGQKYSWRNPVVDQPEAHPVIIVTWNDAQKFCAWLGRKEGKIGELPTEAEWEYACRAGTTTRFWCGDENASLQGNANLADASLKYYPLPDWAKNRVFQSWDDGFPFTSPAGRFGANPWGLYDMHGNVWQWCADRYGEYRNTSVKDPKGPDSGETRVSRGGSWSNEPRDCRSATRHDEGPGFRQVNFGFRVVLRLAPSTP